jgi:hypothetical protein
LFSDTQVERNALMERVYPKLKEYCQEHGYEFQVIDIRWGIKEAHIDDHVFSELCIREIQTCQNISTGPNFVVREMKRSSELAINRVSRRSSLPKTLLTVPST